jgi:hypothetical protein
MGRERTGFPKTVILHLSIRVGDSTIPLPRVPETCDDSFRNCFFICVIYEISLTTQNLASTTWVVYSPKGLLVSSGGICLGPSTNNEAEYSIVIEILHNDISHGIRSLEVHLDTQLVVRQLNGHYRVRDPTLLG